MGTCEGVWKSFIFQLWDNPAVYKILPEGLACPGLFTRQKGPGRCVIFSCALQMACEPRANVPAGINQLLHTAGPCAG